MGRFPYDKKVEKQLTGKQTGGAGPRDRQRANRIADRKSTVNLPDNFNEFGLTFEAIAKKIGEAVQFTRKEETVKNDEGVLDLKKQIINLKNQIEEKDKLLFKFSQQYAEAMDDLKKQINQLMRSLSGSSVVSVVESDRPTMQDKVFIDPDEGGKKLDSHIDITKSSVGKDVKGDVDKLRRLVNKNK